MELDKKILDVIKEGLPEATVGAFKEGISQLEQLANQVEPLRVKLDNLNLQLKKVAIERDSLLKLKDKAEELIILEKKLNDRDIDLKIKEGIYKVKNELIETRVSDHKEMFATVFKNPTLRTEIFNNKSKSDSQDYSNNINEVSNTTITKKEEW